MTINVHIERLVLDGLPYEGRHGARVQAALQAELARLLTGPPGRLSRGSAVDLVRAQPVTLDPSSSAEAVGRKIAGCVHGGLSDGVNACLADCGTRKGR